MSTLRERPRGFTLVELIVVIVVIGVLASFGVPRFMTSVERTKAIEAFQFLSAVRSAQERYKVREGSYAPDLSKLEFQWRVNLSNGTHVLKYFRLKNVDANRQAWSATLERTGASNGYRYCVTYGQNGYDHSRSTIDKFPSINPAQAFAE